jgi:hypothetical protein
MRPFALSCRHSRLRESYRLDAIRLPSVHYQAGISQPPRVARSCSTNLAPARSSSQSWNGHASPFGNILRRPSHIRSIARHHELRAGATPRRPSIHSTIFHWRQLQIRRCAASQLRDAVEDHRVFREADGASDPSGLAIPVLGPFIEAGPVVVGSRVWALEERSGSGLAPMVQRRPHRNCRAPPLRGARNQAAGGSSRARGWLGRAVRHGT